MAKDVIFLRPNKPYVYHFDHCMRHPLKGTHMHVWATVAFLWDGGVNVTGACSVCSPKDKFDPVVGHKRAVGRLKSKSRLINKVPIAQLAQAITADGNDQLAIVMPASACHLVDIFLIQQATKAHALRMVEADVTL